MSKDSVTESVYSTVRVEKEGEEVGAAEMKRAGYMESGSDVEGMEVACLYVEPVRAMVKEEEVDEPVAKEE